MFGIWFTNEFGYDVFVGPFIPSDEELPEPMAPTKIVIQQPEPDEVDIRLPVEKERELFVPILAEA